MKIILFHIILVSSLSNAQIPEHYYDSVSNQSGDSLKSALHNIIKEHKEYPYTSKSTDVWDIIKLTDRDPEDSTKVIGIYSGFSMVASEEYNKGKGWTREHVWAKSRGNFGTKKGAGTDIHHLRAADVSTNSARNNRNFNNGGDRYVDIGGVYNGTTNSYVNDSTWSWEARDEVKGDVARMMFYMVVRYEGENGEPDLELTDSLFNKSSKAPLHSKLGVLLEWHEFDPVDSLERIRNDIVYKYQGNRNPFIDYPEWVRLIFGDDQ